jgi:hypothetical protein
VGAGGFFVLRGERVPVAREQERQRLELTLLYFQVRDFSAECADITANPKCWDAEAVRGDFCLRPLYFAIEIAASAVDLRLKLSFANGPRIEFLCKTTFRITFLSLWLINAVPDFERGKFLLSEM